MCGRYTLAAKRRQIMEHFAIEARLPEFAPSYNISPAQSIPVVWQLAEAGRQLSLMHWGLIPHWLKTPESRFRMINARAETLAARPAYRDAFRHRRCLIPADGFYEWQAGATGKRPYYFCLPDHGLFAFAGLWEYWEGEHGIYSCTLVTTRANAALAPIHDRMPVIIPRERYAEWLDPGGTDVRQLQALLQPAPDALLQAYPVGVEVNRPDHDSPELIRPRPA